MVTRRSWAGGSGVPVEVEVRRSTRRRRTVSAFREDGRIVVCLPARLSAAEEAQWVDTMLAKLQTRERRQAPSDARLAARAAALSARYLDGRAVAASVRFVDDQNRRWGSCTAADRSIRLSRRITAFPTWVQDYVLVHELAHLLVASHNAQFWSWVERYPQAERARGFLEGVAYAESPAADSSGPGSGPLPSPSSLPELSSGEDSPVR